jgi:hypothetical protein
MGLKETVKRLEAATCANETCWLCEVTHVMGTAFDHALKRHGIDCAALPRDLEEFACGECGRRYLENVYGRDADTRRELRELSEDFNPCLVARTAIPDELSRRLKDLMDKDARHALVLYGAAYTEANEAADEAARQWFNEHEAESVAALSRAPLVQRRGLAA